MEFMQWFLDICQKHNGRFSIIDGRITIYVGDLHVSMVPEKDITFEQLEKEYLIPATVAIEKEGEVSGFGTLVTGSFEQLKKE